MPEDKVDDAIAYLKTLSWEDNEICIISVNEIFIVKSGSCCD